MFEKLIAWVFAKIVCPKIRIEFTDGDNSYSHIEEKIFIDPNHKPEDFGFLRHLRQKHKCSFVNLIDVRLWTILHEIGHYHTLDYCEEDDTETRDLLAIIDTKVALTNQKIQDMYFDLESEWEATEWARLYAEKHIALCEIFTALMR